jgi:hypothetical protein
MNDNTQQELIRLLSKHAESVANNWSSLTDELDALLTTPEPPPTGTVLLAGPTWEPETGNHQILTQSSLADAYRFHRIHQAENPGNLTATNNPPAVNWYATTDVVRSRVQDWMPIPDTENVALEFTIWFADNHDFGWQAKCGYGLMGYHSNQQFPGGGHCHPPDWSIRPVWNRYPNDPNDLSKGQQPLRFGLYIYTSGNDREQLPGQVWPSSTRTDDGDLPASQGGGHRRLVLFNNGVRPHASGVLDWSIKFRNGTLTADVSKRGVPREGPPAYTASLSLRSPANRVHLSCGYGGYEDREGPARSVSVALSDLLVTDLTT